jgi:ABC-type sugar transport system ATPase subunit
MDVTTITFHLSSPQWSRIRLQDAPGRNRRACTQAVAAAMVHPSREESCASAAFSMDCGLTTSTPGLLLELDGIHKRFGGVQALSGASLSIRDEGTVHCLLGQNGSGKSTLLNVLSGQVAPDAGVIRIDGERKHFRSAADASENGIAVVAQETALALDLSIHENVLLGRRLIRSGLRINWRASRAHAERYLGLLGLDVDPNTLVRALPPDQQQLVEISRALSMDVRILVLDEPTSSLTDDQVSRLFAAIRSLRQEGVAVVFVSHRLPELFEIGDHVTVLRDGRTVASGPTAEFDPDRLVAAMVGGAKEAPSTERSHALSAIPERQRLVVRGLCAAGVREANMEVAAGEIVGLAGLVAAGRSELMEAIFGVRAPSAGQILLDGNPVRLRNERDAIAAGMAYLPPDRKTRGVLLHLSVERNLTIVSTLERPWWGRPHRSETLDAAGRLSERLGVRAATLAAPLVTLSGGNQQKVAIGKWLAMKPRFLLLDEPTRGVDVAAKIDIHELLREAASEGVGILVSSSENDELLTLCDRILVMVRGRIAADVACSSASEISLTRLAGGHAK